MKMHEGNVSERAKYNIMVFMYRAILRKRKALLNKNKPIEIRHMTQEEMNKLIEDNNDLLGKLVIYDYEQWIFKRFEPKKFSDGDCVLNVLLEQGTKGITVPFDVRESFLIWEHRS